MRGARPNTGAEEAEADAPAPSAARSVWNQFGTLAVAVLVALAVRSCVIEPYRIPSGSMLPTLLIGDHLFVNKFIYGVKVPFTDARLPALRAPKRGDVVVFTVARLPGQKIAPADLAEGGLQDRFVKRIVGLPGDRVEVRGAHIWINGKAAPTLDLEERFVDDFGNELRVLEENLDGDTHQMLDDTEKNTRDQSFVVPADRYFMMGDNRDYSNDSRRWGTVRLAEMKGPAFVIYWSWDWNGRWRELVSPVTWWELFADKMRWDRLGEVID
jgi:signal peptidase I